MPNCTLCGEPMAEGEEMFKFHGLSGPCPRPPLPRATPAMIDRAKTEALFEDHYWDSFQQDKDLILKHVKSVLDMAEKAR